MQHYCKIFLTKIYEADFIFSIGSEGWKIFTGNELGALLGWWVIHSYKKIHGKTHPKLVVLSSTVSSAILKSMARIEGIRFEVNYLYYFL